MEINTFSTRRRTLARILAVLIALPGVYIAVTIVSPLFRKGMLHTGHFPFLFFVAVPMLFLTGLLFFTAFRLWSEVSFLTVRRAHFAVSFVLFWLLLVPVIALLEPIEEPLPATFSSFCAFLLTGVFYWTTRRRMLAFWGIEDVSFEEKAQGLQHYLGWLALFSWTTLTQLARALMELRYEKIDTLWQGLITVVAPLLAAILFYKVAKYFMITRPLQRFALTKKE